MFVVGCIYSGKYLSGICLVGEMSVRDVSGRGSVRRGMCLVGEVSVGDKSAWGNVRRGCVWSEKSPSGNVCQGCVWESILPSTFILNEGLAEVNLSRHISLSSL